MSVLSIGTFDGIHLGHRKLLSTVCDLAQKEGLASIIVTYTDHPAFVLNNKALPGLLCPLEIKQQVLQELGINRVEMLDFTQELANTTAQDFLEQIIMPRWKPKIIVVGYDSHFGKNRKGNREFLELNAQKYGFRLVYIEPELFEGKVISSTTIRSYLVLGEVEKANLLLGRNYRLSGKVGKGLCRGREFGFPTANLLLSNPHQLIPKEGLYFCIVHLQQGAFFALTNIGKSPTVKRTRITEIESHLIDFSGDLYGETMQVELLHYLREERMFANTDELIRAMKLDLQRAQALIAELQE
ncbi:MAG: bifunctional riboflavin kinase/FAD synthetase [Candidatus Cloacimonetes bacterium]|nr:bifunctional riboflavin kinase/FAD synthetase [Candidatus Cloacimonadota bacterium]